MANQHKSLNGIFEPTARRVRVKFNGEIIADSRRAMLMRESRYELHYYFPVDDVQMEYLVPTEHGEQSGHRGESVYWTVQVGEQVAENAAWAYPDVAEKRPDLRGYVAFVWNAMDTWYEEDEQVFGHARDPYHRIDTIQSSRHIRVEVDGVTVAETTRPYLLFETGLPVRYYIPREDVRAELITAAATPTICPYKGSATYWNIEVNGQLHEGIVWGYPDPVPEIPKIKDTVSFYNEKVDIYVDGELERKPRTVFA